MPKQESRRDSQARPVPRLKNPSVGDMTDEIGDELMELESRLTIFQLMLLVQAHEQGDGGVGLWEPTWVWVSRDDLLLYQAPSVLDARTLRELAQIKELEALALIRLEDTSGDGDWHWKLTARGEVAAAWYMSALADHQPDWEATS